MPSPLLHRQGDRDLWLKLVQRQVTGERIRDKIAASKRKGMWMGGPVPLGYDARDKLLVVNKEEAETVRYIYTRYLELGCVRKLKADLDSTGHVSKTRKSAGGISGGMPFSRGALYTLLKNPIYVGKIAHKGATHDGQHTAVVETTLWEQVQQQLSENKIRRNTRTIARGASLLAGLLYDDKGNPMSPTHATKQNRRYRYYISQAVLQYREADEGSVIRIPAQTIERTVTDEIKRLLSSSRELLKMVIIGNLPANKQKTTIRKAKSMADMWDEQSYPDQISLLKKIIQRVTVSQQEICILFSRNSLASILLIDNPMMDHVTDSYTDCYRVNIPAALKRCGIETKLIISGEDAPQAHPNSVRAIQDALAKALVWNQALVTGSTASMTVLAKEEGVTQRYIAHLIKLAFLAPDIMESVIKGDIPASLSLGSLKKGIPLDWQKQRDLFGFA